MDDNHALEGNFLIDASDEFKAQVDDIIDTLRIATNTVDLEAMIMALLKQILEQLYGHDQGGERGVDFDLINEEQRSLLVMQLEKIATEMQSRGEIEHTDDPLARLFRNLIRSLVVEHRKRQVEKDRNLVNKKQLDVMKKEMERMIIYEMYKLLTPRQIAGKSAEQTFLNNVVHFGKEMALKYEEKTHPERSVFGSFTQHLEEEHKPNHQAPHSPKRGVDHGGHGM